MNRSLMLLLLLAPPLMEAQIPLGPLSACARGGPSVTLHAGDAAVRFRLYARDVLRVDFLPGQSSVEESSLVVVRPPSPLDFTMQEDDSTLTLVAPLIRVVCTKNPLRIAYMDSVGRPLLREPVDGGLSVRGERKIARFTIAPGQRFYGTGERGIALDLRGEAFQSVNRQVGGYTTPLATMNLNVPFLPSSGGFALYFDTTYEGGFDIGASDSAVMSYEASSGPLSYYLIVAPTIPRQLERYSWLTGRQPLPPRWAFGFIQSRNRYRDESEARSIVQTMRTRRFPCDALVLDLKWFREMGDLSWDSTAWPAPDAMMSDFLAAGIKTILITEPYIVERSVNFATAFHSGFLTHDSLGRPYLLEKWWSCDGCRAGLLDITNPHARQWWWSLHPPFLGRRVAGLWTDLGEPERHPPGMVHALGSAARVHNIYNLLWARTVYEGMQFLRPDSRVFNLTRSGFAGIQRYGVLPWSGDVARTFGGLGVQLPMLLNMGMSGLGYHNSDIGGYARNPTTPELYVRWMQYGTFCPITRAHGAGEEVRGAPTEPWRFGAEAERICREFISLRYRLLPYIYTLAHENWTSGMPLARPLFFSDPDDPRLFNESSSYLWGDALLVSPVVTAGQRTKQVYLPAGEWIDFWSDSLYHGKQAVSVDTPLDRMPLFVRGGSIVPMAPLMSYSDERPLDTLTLAIYPTADGNGSCTMYEDDGTTLAYQQGACATTSVTLRAMHEEEPHGFEILVGATLGSYEGKPARRVCLIDLHRLPHPPTRVTVNGAASPSRSSLEELRGAGSGYWYDPPTRRLLLQIHKSAGDPAKIILTGAKL